VFVVLKDGDGRRRSIIDAVRDRAVEKEPVPATWSLAVGSLVPMPALPFAADAEAFQRW
jgi:hypothetical protein